MIFEIVFGILAFVVGIVILTGKVDKWLIYPSKQTNEKRFRLVTGIAYLSGGVWFILIGYFGYNAIFLALFWVWFIVLITLQYTWCRMSPENQTNR